MPAMFHQTVRDQLLGAELHLYFVIAILEVLKKIKRLVDVLLSNKVLFTFDLAFLDAFDQFRNDFRKLVGDALADENERELSLWKQDTLDELTEMQKEYVDGHEDQ